MRQKVPLLCTDWKNSLSPCLGKRGILFGAGLFLRPAIHSLGQRGIQVDCICDNSPAKQGMTIRAIPVMSPTEARAAHPNDTVIITAAPKYIDEIHSQATALGWTRVCDGAPLLASFQYDRTSFESGVSQLHFDLDEYFCEYFRRYHPERLIIPSLDVVITEKCSLRCRDCANLMQYYTDPQDVDFDKLFASLDIFMECVDQVLEFRVLGGETFMNRHAHRYIDRLREYRNYTRIAVYSNGTIPPSGENLDCLIQEDTYLRISDYGPLSRNLQKMVEIFDEHRVIYDVLAIDGWQDCAGIKKRERTVEQLSAVHASCCASKSLSILNGRLYGCPFAANASYLGALPPFPGDSLTLDRRLSRSELRGWLFDTLRTRRSFSACEYCAGRPIGVAAIPAALQAPSPLTYKRIYPREG
jgi:hypothetical protein